MSSEKRVDIGICAPRKRKKLLQVICTEPDDRQRLLMNKLARGYHSLVFALFEENTDSDYDDLIDLIFDHDEVVTWW